MSKINDLISPKIEVTFRDEKFILENGFTLEETPAINLAFGQKDIATRAEGLKQLLKVIVRRLYPTAKESEISQVDAKFAPELLEVFYQLDNTEDKEQDEIKKTLEKVKGAQ
ncbi:MAG: hypothetical protein DRJ35_08460 [Thermoprotei archaeon]|nr:MAG: hypothetical protein DRJ35_08460 [Thermoprotei archaeon]